MGVVHAAHDPDLHRRVALKLLRPAPAAGSSREDSDDARLRFLREARAMAQVRHPNVITVYEVGDLPEGAFIAMELIDGRTLADWLAEAPRMWPEILACFEAAGRGLAAAHRAGLVHRDFKPANVLIERAERGRAASPGGHRGAPGADERAVVTDFGLVSWDEGETGPGGMAAVEAAWDAVLAATVRVLTATGVLVGTPAYMAPEQYRGAPVDARTDQFAFCVALFESLYRVHPFLRHPEMRFGALRGLVLNGRIVPRPRRTRVPRAVHAVLVRGLAPDPDHRYPDMDALLAALARAARAPRRRVLAGVAAVAVVAAVATGLGVRHWTAPADPTPPPTAPAAAIPPTPLAPDPGPSTVPTAPARPTPDDPVLAHQVDAVRVDITAVQALRDASEPIEAVARAQQVVERARKVDYPPLLAEALYCLSEAQMGLFQIEVAMTTLRETVRVSTDAGDERVRAQALVALFELAARFLPDDDDIAASRRRAVEATERAGPDQLLSARLDAGTAEWLVRRKRELERARTLGLAALPVFQRVGDTSRRFSTLRTVVRSHVEEGDFAPARALLEPVLEELSTQYGNEHVSTLDMLELGARLMRRMNQPDLARAYLSRVEGFWRSERGLALFRATSYSDGVLTGERRVSGRVLSPEGDPVAGADVRIAHHAQHDGKYALFSVGSADLIYGRQEVQTDDRGQFTIEGVPDRAMYLVAEHDQIGRSFLAEIDDQGDEAGMTLRLRSYAQASGTVTLDRSRYKTARVHFRGDEPLLARDYGVIVHLDRAGRYSIERLAAGRYRFYVFADGPDGEVFLAPGQVDIAPGQHFRQDLRIDAPLGDNRVDVLIRGKGGVAIGGVQVSLLEDAAVEQEGSYEDFMKLYLSDVASATRVGFARPVDLDELPSAQRSDQHKAFTEVPPGRHSICAIPLSMPADDPSLRTLLAKYWHWLQVYCVPITVADGPARQSFVVVVPPMPKLPTAE